MNKEEKYTIAKWAMDQTLKSGAEAARVIISTSNSSQVEVRETKIDKLEEAKQNNMQINLYVGNRYSSISTSRLNNKDELAGFIKNAIAGARYLSEDKFRTLPDPELYYKGNGEDLKTVDDNFNTLDPQLKINKAFTLEKEILGSDDRIISISSSYRDNLDETVMVASNGFEGDTQGSSFSVYTSVSVRDGDSRPQGSWYDSSIFIDEIDLNSIGEIALKRALDKLGQRKIKSAKMPLIIENRLVANILSPMISALNGASIYQKNSYLIGMEDKKIASAMLDITDDPFIISGRGSRHFDSEGLATMKRSIIENGVLNNFFIDTYYGKKLDLKPTSGNTTNLVLKPGNKSMDAMLKDINRGILVTDFKGGNSNGATGDFSYGIEGFLIENGAIIHPVSEMNISGNFKELWNNLSIVGNDVYTKSSWLLPSLVFDNVSFSGI